MSREDGVSGAAAPMELPKRMYSAEEVHNIYELARYGLENGDLNHSEVLFRGLSEVAPHFAPAWLGLAYISLQTNQIDQATIFARRALQSDQNSVEAQLYLISCLLISEDYGSAGTLLGEVQEKIEGGFTTSPYVLRFYRMQLARYNSR